MRSRFSRTAVVGLGVSLFTLLGCDSGEAEPARVTECRNICERREMCIAATDLSDCEKRCDDQEFRSDLYYQSKAKCVLAGDLSCDGWASELDERGGDLCLGEGCNLDTCVRRELAGHQLSEEQEDYCETLSSKLFACDRGLDLAGLVSGCKDALLELSAEYAAETEECVGMNCIDGTEIPACLEKLSARYGTELKIFTIPAP